MMIDVLLPLLCTWCNTMYVSFVTDVTSSGFILSIKVIYSHVVEVISHIKCLLVTTE